MQLPKFPIAPIFNGEIPEAYWGLLLQKGVHYQSEFNTLRMVLNDPVFATPEIISNWFSHRFYQEIDPAEWPILDGNFYKVYKNPFTDDPSASILYEFRLGAVQVTLKGSEKFITLSESAHLFGEGNGLAAVRPDGNNVLQPRRSLATDVRITATIDAALRSFIGAEYEMNSDNALGFAQFISTVSIARDNPRAQSEATQLIAIIDHERKFIASSNANYEIAHNIAALVKGIYEGSTTYADLVGRVKDNNNAAIEIAINRLWALEYLYSYEGRDLESDNRFENTSTRNFFIQCLASKLLDSSPEQLIVSTEDFGPFYNRRNRFGYMLPGDFDVSEVPSGSFGGLLGIRGANGEIEFRFDEARNSMAYLTKEDIDTALVLAFGDDKPLMPSISMNNLDDRTPFLAEKVWEPEWLGKTAFGKTLYATDYWMGRICGFKNGELHANEILADYLKATQEIVLGLHEIGLRVDNTNFNLRPMQIDWFWETDANNQEHRCTIKKITMGMLSEKAKFDSENKQYVNEWSGEDTGHSKIFNERYDEIATMWPIFERQRHLVALTRSLTELRERGFQPSAALADRISKMNEAFNSQPALKFQDRLVLWT